MNDALEAALAWSHQIQQGEGLRLHDLCLSTVQRHVGTLVQAAGSSEVEMMPDPQIVYRSLCPVCGASLILHRLEET